MHAARVLRRKERRIIGLTIDGRPFNLASSKFHVISIGVSLDPAMVLYISAICSCMASEAYFVSSTRISSHPGLLLGFIMAITFPFLSTLKNIAISVGSMALIGCLLV